MEGFEKQINDMKSAHQTELSSLKEQIETLKQ